MAEIVCPECGQVTELPAIRRSADEFCRHCDYPLFWAPAAVPLTVSTETHEAMLRKARVGHVTGGATFGYTKVRVNGHTERTIHDPRGTGGRHPSHL